MHVVPSAWNRIRQLPVFLPGRRPILLVRLALLLAIAVALHAGSVAPDHQRIVWPVLGGFLLSWFGSLLLSRASLETTRFRVPFLLADTFLLAFLLSLSGPDAPRSFLFFFLMVLIIALGNGLFRILLGSACLTGVFFLGSFTGGSGFAGMTSLPSPFLVPLFGVAALYYAYFVAEARHRENLADRVLRERQELRVILDILEATTSTLDFHAVMHTTTERMAELMNSARVSIVLVDRKREECTVLVSSDNRSLNQLPIPLAKYPEIQRALETGAPVIIQDVAKSPLVAAVREDLQRLGFHSLLVIPLRYGEEIFGTICLRASRTDKGFAPDEVRFAQIVASAAANAVKNSLLYSRVQGEARVHRERSAHLQLLFDHMPDLIFLLDREWRIEDVNRSVPDRIAVPREQILHRELREWCPKAASLPAKVRSLPPGEFHACGEVDLRRREGPPLAVRLGIIPLAGGQGFLALAQDISSEKRTEMELQHADRLSAVGELVATVAHELRGRLTGVLGFSQLLAIRNRDPDLARDLERISTAAEQCKTIVNDLLSFSRKTEPDRKVLGVNGILRKALDLLERQMEESGIRVTLDLAQDLPLSLLDFQQIQQVFVNILTNAQQAIATTGRPGAIQVRTRGGQNEVVVEIRDDGPGMPEAVLCRIFDPFFTTKPAGEGTGLGLSISYGIVQSHGGRIEAESEPGRGTVFHVRLPATDRKAESPAAASQAQGPPTQRILVVDDDPTIVELYVAVLRDLGHRVDTAMNGVEALRKLAEQPYGLIISDLRMPKMNGLELLKRVQTDHPDLARRFVFTTGDMNYMNSYEFITLSDIPCLVKPLDIQEVERVVGRILAA